MEELKVRVPSIIEPLIRPHARTIINKVYDFVEDYCLPLEAELHRESDEAHKKYSNIFEWHSETIEKAKIEARRRGLWNLWLHEGMYDQPAGANLSNVEYAVCAEIMGRCGHLAPEAMNSAAPDTGNMEVLIKYGSQAQKDKWLPDLLDGKIRSAYCMTERRVASSDATNVETSIVRDGDEYVINGHKWWASGAGRARCKVLIVMGKSDPNNSNKHSQQSMILVPRNTPGVRIIRHLTVFGYDDSPEGHFEIKFENVRVPASNLILGEGRGFEIAQGRLGPGRIHHCMRTVGAAERCLDLMLIRGADEGRRAFGKLMREHGSQAERIALSRIDIDASRLLVLSAAHRLDVSGTKNAIVEIAEAKVLVPRVALQVCDYAIQMFGAEGVSQDQALSTMWAGLRTIRIVDGPDEVHILQIGRNEIKRAAKLHELAVGKAYNSAKVAQSKI